MIVGVLVFLSGLLIYNNARKNALVIAKDTKINNLIESAIADNYLTSRERENIKRLAKEQGLNYENIINKLESELSASKTEFNRDIQDDNKKKGHDFEKFIVQKFNKNIFTIKDWAGDKYVNGVYAETSQHPDMKIELKKEKIGFAVECKWNQKLYNDGFQIKEEQFSRYKRFEETENIPVFMAVGIGGTPSCPDQLYIIPLKVMGNNFIQFDDLFNYRKKVNGNFTFYADTKTLR